MARLMEQLLRRFAAPQQPRPLESYVDLVDDALANLGIDAELESGEEGWSWGLQVGSAELTIELHLNEILQEWTLEIRSAILRLPDSNLLAFYRRCLELNRLLVGCSIGVDQDRVVVASERTLPELDTPGFMRMLLNVASAADQCDDDLAEEFGARKLGQA
ncbi:MULTISPECIES: YbjN domain-containing protein [Aphanothece]|uniref:YbjN domain-containing protein n=1 Tax=Aphanothece TaxID=1121 RepID=UPI00398F8551